MKIFFVPILFRISLHENEKLGVEQEIPIVISIPSKNKNPIFKI
tara:strand:- start:615 stop:746 length:132 start_codon:yes stop_codon:yes gene_type:complete